MIAVTATSTSANAASYEIAAPAITADAISLDWTAQEGADAYKVYIFDNEAGNYVVYKMFSSDSCKVEGLKPETKYKFRIESLKKDDNGKYEKISTSGVVAVSTTSVSASQPDQPTQSSQPKQSVQSEPKQDKTEKTASESDQPLKRTKADKSELSLKIETMKAELVDTRAKLAVINKDITDCRKRQEANRKIIESCQNAQYDIEEQKKVAIARQELEEDTALMQWLQMEEHRLLALRNRLLSQLHSMGCRDV